jgi:hypothetical protein
MTELTNEQITKLLKTLEHAIEHPHMYFSAELPPVTAFFYGFEAVFKVLGIAELYKVPSSLVAEERGWHPSNRHIAEEMIEKGLSTDELTRELFVIQKIAWEKFLEQRIKSINPDDSQ